MDILQKTIDWEKQRRRPNCSDVIVAAGASTRMNGIDKMTADLNGESVILRTLRVFNDCRAIGEIIVVTREDLVVPIEILCTQYDLDKVRCVTLGGDERTSSVMAGLGCVSDKAELVAIHDGARPLVTTKLIEKVVDLAAKTGAAAPAIPMKDTVKVVRKGVIEATPDRSSLVAIQTPQIFDVDLVKAALFKAEQEGIAITDDCSAVERMGMKVHIAEGSDENIKITTPTDLVIARRILSAREKQ